MSRIVPVLLITALVGLIVIQYQFLVVGLRLEKETFDMRITESLSNIEDDLSQDNKLTYLLGRVLSRDPGRFRVGMDTLNPAAAGFLEDFLTDRLQQQSLTLDYQFALRPFANEDPILWSDDFRWEDEKPGRYSLRIYGELADECNCQPVLTLQIEQLLSFLLSQLNRLIIPAVAALLVIVFCFLWYAWVIRQQRRVDQTKNDFINHLTHELKTPVFSMGLATKMLQDRLGDQHQDLLSLLRKENLRMQKHLDKVLSLASLERRKALMQQEPVDLHQVLELLLENTEQRVSSLDGTFIVMLAPLLDPVPGDARHIENAVSSLLDNAIKYSEDPPQIAVRTWQTGSSVHICVIDQGIGIPAEAQTKVFDHFFRISNGDRQTAGGFGLGLSYVQQVMRLHRGEVQLESGPGQGTKITLVFPSAQRKD